MHPALSVLTSNEIPLVVSALPKVLSAYVLGKQADNEKLQIEKETFVAFIENVHPSASVMLEGLTTLSKDSTHLSKEALAIIQQAIEIARQCMGASSDSAACDRHMDRIVQLVGEARHIVEDQRRHQRFLYKVLFAATAGGVGLACFIVRRPPNATMLNTARKILRIG